VSLDLAPYIAASELSRWKRDPIAAFTFKNPIQRTLVANIAKAEIYLHAANLAGKTTGGAALGVALARGCESLDGVSLPTIEMPATGALVVGSYKQAVESSFAAYRRLIGEWPSHEAMILSSMDYVGIFYIKPDGWRSDDYKTWSRIYVFTHDGEMPEGLRLDFVHADEPPPIQMWRALRFRFKAERNFYAWITATPIHENEWGPFMQEEEFLHSLGQIRKGKLRLQSSIYDNSALVPMDIERAERAAATDPHGRARLFGEHVDISGSCPFDQDGLRRMRESCRPPEREIISVSTKRPEAIGDTVQIALPISVWGERDDRDSYYLTADLASGIRSPTTDPLCIHVWARLARRLVVTYLGYVHPFGLGWLAADLARRYTTPISHCKIDPERNAGYIDQFLEGMHANGYYAVEYDHSRTGKATRIGYVQTESTRQNLVLAWQRSIMNNDCIIESEEVISCLANCIVDGEGLVRARHGYHDEHMICGGRALDILNVKGARRPRDPKPDDLGESFQYALKQSFGRDVASGSRARVRGPRPLWTPRG
jgi:hypothetical protein